MQVYLINLPEMICLASLASRFISEDDSQVSGFFFVQWKKYLIYSEHKTYTFKHYTSLITFMFQYRTMYHFSSINA